MCTFVVMHKLALLSGNTDMLRRLGTAGHSSAVPSKLDMCPLLFIFKQSLSLYEVQWLQMFSQLVHVT